MSTPLRILLVGPGPNSAGGVSAVLATLLDSELTDHHELRRVVTHQDGSALTKLRTALGGYGAVARELVLRRPEVAWINNSADASFRRKSVVMAMARLARVPYLLHVHAGSFGEYYASAGRFEQALIRWGLSGAAAQIALSETWKQVLDDISGAEAVVIPNPVALPPEPTDGQRVAGRILFLGRYGEHKGILRLVDALAQISNRHPEAHIVCAGDGDRAEVVAHAEQRGIGDRIEAHGWLDHAAGQRLLSSATIFALPSHGEGLPVALLEAMAHGAAPVATPVGGIPELIEHGQNGLLGDSRDTTGLADHLDLLLSAPDRCQAVGERARATIAERYSVTIAIQALEAVFREACGHSNAPESPKGARPRP